MKGPIFLALSSILMIFTAVHSAAADTTNKLLEQLNALQQNFSNSPAKTTTQSGSPNPSSATSAVIGQNANLPAAGSNASNTNANTSNVQPNANANPSGLLNAPNATPAPNTSAGSTNLPSFADNQQPATAQSIQEDAFQSVAQSNLPMTPDQIQRLKRLFSDTQLAAASSVQAPPKPVATSQIVNLAPGVTPPVIRLAQGFISSLVFLDSTGGPWPIEAYDVGNSNVFNIQWDKKDNTLMIQSTSNYTFGNLAVRLKGLVTPVVLTLIPGQKVVDYRVDLHIQGIGPNPTSLPSTDGLPATANQELLNVLAGIPPMGSRLLQVKGGNCQAWLYKDYIYLRTSLTLLSPAWLATMSSADGMHAYQLPKVPILLASSQGKTVHLIVEGL